VDACAGDADVGQWEHDFQVLLFRIVRRPLFELLTRVTLRFASNRPASEAMHRGEGAIEAWKRGRHRIIDAILSGDEELARFEADRSNRRIVLASLDKQRSPHP
jgi:DNA-binding FadR family transcriptional regulator